MGEPLSMKTAVIALVLALSGALAMPAAHPIPTVTGSFCDTNTDFMLDASGKTVGTNFTYKLCMDMTKAAFRTECLGADVPCPNGPNTHIQVLVDQVIHVPTTVETAQPKSVRTAVPQRRSRFLSCKLMVLPTPLRDAARPRSRAQPPSTARRWTTSYTTAGRW